MIGHAFDDYLKMTAVLMIPELTRSWHSKNAQSLRIKERPNTKPIT